MDISKKNTFIILFIILILSFSINILTFKNGHNWNNIDFIDYIYQTRSLVDGNLDELVSMNEYLADNSTRNMGGLIGLWGFPILLSPVYHAFGLDVYAMKVFINLFFILSLFVVFLLFQDRLNNIQNLLLVSILAFNAWFFDFKDNVLSDIPFLFFSLFSLFLIQRFVISKKIWINKFVSYSLIGVFIFISYQIRAVGLILLPTLLVVQYIESRSSSTNKFSITLQLSNSGPYIIFIILTFIIMSILPEGAVSSYRDLLLSKDFSKIISDIMYLILTPSRLFPFLFLKMNVYGFSYNKFSLIIYALMLMFVIFGMIKSLKTDYMYFLYMLFSIPVIVIFSQRGGGRLLIPIFPFFIYFLFIGLSKVTLSFDISGKYNPFKINIVYLLSIGLIIISFFYISKTANQNIIFNKSNSIEGPFSTDSTELFGYVKAHTNKDDVIISYNPTVIIFFTDRKSFALNRYYFKFDQLLNSGADYLAYNKIINPYDLTTQKLRKNFKCILENSTYLFCILKKPV